MGLMLSYRKEMNIATVSGFETIGKTLSIIVFLAHIFPLMRSFSGASLDGQVQIGDELVAANSVSLEGVGGEAVFSIIKSSTWPIRLRLRRRSIRHIPTPPKHQDGYQAEDSSSNSTRIEELTLSLDGLTDAFTTKCVEEQAALNSICAKLDKLPELHALVTNLSESYMNVLDRLERLEAVAASKRQDESTA